MEAGSFIDILNILFYAKDKNKKNKRNWIAARLEIFSSVYFSNHFLCSLQSIWISRGHEISSNLHLACSRKYIFIITCNERNIYIYIFFHFYRVRELKKVEEKKKEETINDNPSFDLPNRSIWLTLEDVIQVQQVIVYQIIRCLRGNISKKKKGKKNTANIFIWKHSRQSGLAHKMAIITRGSAYSRRK